MTKTKTCGWTATTDILMKHILKQTKNCKYHKFLSCLMDNHAPCIIKGKGSKKKIIKLPALKENQSTLLCAIHF